MSATLKEERERKRKDLHYEMINELSNQIVGDYLIKFKELTKAFLEPCDLPQSSNFTEVCGKLFDKKRIAVGKYELLINKFGTMEHIVCQDIVKDYAKRIDEINDQTQQQPTGAQQSPKVKPTDAMVTLVESWKKDDEEFVSTPSTKKIEEAIKSSNVITITGCSGSGKSSNMHHMTLKLHKDGYWVYPVQEFEEITKEFYDKDTNTQQVFTLDDPFGINQLCNDKLDNFRGLNGMLKACLKDKSKKLFMTVRTEIYEELPKSTIASVKIVDLGDRNEFPDERRNFLCEMMRDEPDEYILGLASKCDVPFFPLICHLYLKDEKYKGSEVVFVNSARVLKDRFKEMLCENRSRFCALAMCLVYSGERMPLKGVTEFTDDDKKLHRRITSFDKNLDINDLKKQLKLLSGVYIEENREIYKFRHDIFRNIVAYVLAEEKKRFFMEHCDMEFCLEIFTFGLPTINDRFCLNSDISRAKTISVDRQNIFNKRSSTLDKKDSLTLEKSLIDLLATKCVDKLNASTKEGTFSKVVNTIINSEFLQNAYFLGEFQSKVKNSNMNRDHIDKIQNEIFVSACLSLEPSAIGDIFPDLWPYKIEQDNKITDVTPLLACAYSSKIDTMKQLVQAQGRYEKEVISERPISPLCLSVFKLNYTSVEFLLENHAVVNCGDPTPFSIALEHYGDPTPFSKALEQSSSDIANLLIKKGANINKKYRHDKGGYFTTPLCWACEKGCKKRVKYLIDNDADVNACDGLGNSPLANAVNSDYVEIIDMLLEHENIDLNICGEGENARTPLCWACFHGNTKLVALLLGYGANVNKCDGFGNSPLTNAVNGDCKKIIQILLKSKTTTDLNICGEGENAQTPLCSACYSGNKDLVERLLRHDANVNKCDGLGNSPLINAVNGYCIEKRQKLKNKTTDSNICGEVENARTSLCSDHFDCYTNIVELLLCNDANVNKCDGIGNSPLTNAVNGDCIEIIEMLLKHEATDLNICGEGENAQTPLCSACFNGNRELVERLVCCKTDVNKCDGNKNSPLINAVKRNHKDIVKCFIDPEVEVNVNQLDREGNTALTCSIWNGYLEITECLLKVKNVDVNFCGEDQCANTPLCAACSLNNLKIVKELIKCEADVNKCDGNGDSPLTIAESFKYQEIIEVLKNSKATSKYRKRTYFSAFKF